jgi:hypothetical protein
VTVYPAGAIPALQSHPPLRPPPPRPFHLRRTPGEAGQVSAPPRIRYPLPQRLCRRRDCGRRPQGGTNRPDAGPGPSQTRRSDTRLLRTIG